MLSQWLCLSASPLEIGVGHAMLWGAVGSRRVWLEARERRKGVKSLLTYHLMEKT